MTQAQTEPDNTTRSRKLSFSIRASALIYILATAIVFCGLLGLTSYTYRYAIDQREQVSDLHLTHLRAAEELRFLYFKYVQTWKNILLRGHNPQSYHAQLSEFYDLERRVQAGIEALRLELDPQNPAIAALGVFENEFFQAGRLYRRALRKFNEDVTDPWLAADTLIRDTQVDPVQRNTELIDALETSRNYSYQQITHEMRRYEKSISLIVLLLIGVFLFAVYYLSNRFILSPIHKGISLAEKISCGDLDNEIETDHAATEINKLLLSLKRMQSNIGLAHQQLITAKEQAEQSNAAKTAFLSRMSHELRTPLHAILGFGQILQIQADPLSERQQNSVRKIIKAGQHLLDLINEVLDLARIENNKLEIAMENVELAEVVAECISLTTPLALERSVSIVNDIPVDYQYLVRADTLRLKQVLINLITNAIKYGFEHGTVILECAETADNKLQIKVRDNGPGIPVDKQHLLFKPFERFDEKRVVEGTGIGLALTKKLVELMNGITGVESEPGRGSTFWIQLQLTNSDYPHHPVSGNASDRFKARLARTKQT